MPIESDDTEKFPQLSLMGSLERQTDEWYLDSDF